MTQEQSRIPDGTRRRAPRGQRVPEGSGLFQKLIPAALVAMAGVTLLLILVAIGVILGLAPGQ